MTASELTPDEFAKVESFGIHRETTQRLGRLAGDVLMGDDGTVLITGYVFFDTSAGMRRESIDVIGRTS